MHQSRVMKVFLTTAIGVGLCLGFGGCRGSLFHQPGKADEKQYSKVLRSDYNTVWQATLDALNRFEKTVQNRQGGVVQTAWVDNTSNKNFIESFSGDLSYLKAKYRMNLTIAQGDRAGKPWVKVSIQKEQMVQRDLLEGWKTVESDGIEENAFLYRIGRIVFVKQKLKSEEERKMKQVLDEGV